MSSFSLSHSTLNTVIQKTVLDLFLTSVSASVTLSGNLNVDITKGMDSVYCKFQIIFDEWQQGSTSNTFLVSILNLDRYLVEPFSESVPTTSKPASDKNGQQQKEREREKERAKIESER